MSHGGRGLRFRRCQGPVGLNLGRRRVGALALGAGSRGPLPSDSRIQARQTQSASHPASWLPRGAARSSRACVKCGECMKVCTTNGLQPAFLEAGLEGLWSPVLVPQIGLLRVPLHALRPGLPHGRHPAPDPGREGSHDDRPGDGRQGTAACPLPTRRPASSARRFAPPPRRPSGSRQLTVRNRNGEPVEVKQPRVDLDLCIGCGICEAKCPVIDSPAIRVTERRAVPFKGEPGRTIANLSPMGPRGRDQPVNIQFIFKPLKQTPVEPVGGPLEVAQRTFRLQR